MAPCAAKSAHEIRLRKRLAHRDQDFGLIEVRQFVTPCLGVGPQGANVQQQIGIEHRVARGDRCAFVDVLGIRKTCGFAGAGFDDDHVAGLEQRRDQAGNQGHAAFAGESFFENADFHGAVSGGQDAMQRAGVSSRRKPG